MSKKLNPLGKFIGGMSKLTEMIYDQYELATTGKVTPTSRHREIVEVPKDEMQKEVIEVAAPVQEEYVNGMIKAVCDRTIQRGKKIPIEFKIEGKTKSLVVELRSPFFQFIVEKEYKQLTNMTYLFTNVAQNDDEVNAYYNAIVEFAADKGYDVSFK